MKSGRKPIIVVALLSGLIAAYLSTRHDPPPAPQLTLEPEIIPAAEVLVATTDLHLGTKLDAEHLKWLPWPSGGLSDGMIVKNRAPDGMAQIVGSIVKENFVANEPINKEKLVQSDAGYLATILPEGKRALAISIDQRGSNSAGTLILPNDHVDVIRIYKDARVSRTQGMDVFSSETLLQNIRVLAIGPNIEEKNGARVAVGETATLELDPDEVNTIALAQRSGALTLALRSIADMTSSQSTQHSNTTTVTIVRGATREDYPVYQTHSTAQ
ncbi:MAG: Flp pilus assembly protein CpaB [Hyphomicrobiales bacterium]|nr:Flp pilus assembly protein CpaB [Hyphomicrobiales bacterium]